MHPSKLKSLYLAGPISGLSYLQARFSWREDFVRLLEPVAPHIACYSPMRSKGFLENEKILPQDSESLKQYKNAMATAKGIITRDFNDVKNVDALVVNFTGAERVSIGTCWEMGAAYALQKPVILIMEAAGNVHDHGFITETAGYRVENLQEAAVIAAALLTPGL